MKAEACKTIHKVNDAIEFVLKFHRSYIDISSQGISINIIKSNLAQKRYVVSKLEIYFDLLDMVAEYLFNFMEELRALEGEERLITINITSETRIL